VALLSVGCFQLLGLVAYSLATRFIDMRWLLMFGLVLFGFGCYLYVPLTNQWGWQELLLPQAMRGFGQQFCIAPIVTMALGSLPPARLKSASGLFNLMRNLGGAIGIAVASTMLNDRLNLHYERLDEHLSVGRPAVLSFLRQWGGHLAGAAGDTLSATQTGIGMLHAMLMREALVLTFSDTFFVLALCFVVGLVSVMFCHPFGNKAPPPDAH
jgi:DHA2 family multidrug resistance protein